MTLEGKSCPGPAGGEERTPASIAAIYAQRGAVAQHAAATGGRIVAEFVEVESGRKRDRPQLAAALAECRRQRGAVLLLAKLNRLARNVAFVSG